MLVSDWSSDVCSSALGRAVLNANVARATHGETKAEVLGSGDGSKAFQKFVLKQKPLTYVSAATPTGLETTLKVRVNDVLWEEASTFFKLPPEKRASSEERRVGHELTTRRSQSARRCRSGSPR